jgi:hypothetical protein
VGSDWDLENWDIHYVVLLSALVSKVGDNARKTSYSRWRGGGSYKGEFWGSEATVKVWNLAARSSTQQGIV